MATEEDKILSIKVDYAEAIKAIVDYQSKIDGLKEAEKELRKQFKDGQISQQEYNEEMAASKIKTQQYSEAVRVLNKEVNNSIKSDKQKDTSLKGLRAALSNLTAEYDALQREERNAAKGKELEAKIIKLTEEIKKAEEGTGRFYRNVGNYMNSIKGAFGSTMQSARAFGAELKLLSANPFLLIIGAIASIINGIADALKSSEEQTNRWRMALAPFNAFLDMTTNKLTEMAGKVLNVVEGAGKMWSKFLDWIGVESELGQVMQKVNTKMQERAELERMQQDYTKAAREEIVKSAEREKQVAELRAKVAQKDKYTAKERLEFLNQAINIEEQQAKRNKELAQMRLDALKKEASFTDNDAEMNDKLTQATAAVTNAETDLFNKQRELNAQRVETINQIKAEEKALRDAEQAIYDKQYAELKSKVQEKLGVSDKEYKELAKPLIERNNLILQNAESLKEGLKKINAEVLKDDRAVAWEQIKIQEEKAKAMSVVTGSLIELVDAVGESSRGAAIASKVIALAQIAIDTGVAISKAVATSSAKGFWGFLAEVGPFIAAIVSNMASAIKTVKSAKFATGGDVSGPGTATSDSIPAMLSDGESVMTAKATSMFAPILSAFNQAGGGVPIYGQQMGTQAMGEDMLAKSFAKGLANMPNPVVSVKEITNVSNRVKVIENINRV